MLPPPNTLQPPPAGNELPFRVPPAEKQQEKGGQRNPGGAFQPPHSLSHLWGLAEGMLHQELAQVTLVASSPGSVTPCPFLPLDREGNKREKSREKAVRSQPFPLALPPASPFPSQPRKANVSLSPSSQGMGMWKQLHLARQQQ